MGRRLAVGVLVAATLFSGCTSDGEPTPDPAAAFATPELAAGKGGILGLLIDDIYRPIPGALLLVEGQGLTATTDERGQFSFVDLEPGSYVLLPSAERHEAAPANVDVSAGEYAEVEVPARRVFSEGGSIITTHYAVFVSCSASTVDRTQPVDCMGDQSGDSMRLGFDSDYRGHGDNVTYLVTEMKANHKASSGSGALKVVVREQGNGDYWASKFTLDGDYIRITMRLGNVSLDDTESRNKEWRNDKRMETLLFPQGGFKAETQAVLDAGCGVAPTCYESRGLGVQAGVKANFVQTLFLGEPALPIDEYHVYAPG